MNSIMPRWRPGAPRPTCHAAGLRQSAQSHFPYDAWPHAAAVSKFSSARPGATASRNSACMKRSIDGSRLRFMKRSSGAKPFCNLHPFRARLPNGHGSRSEDADRRADVRPLCDAAARHRRSAVAAIADIYITDWIDARMVPMTEGTFDLDDYIDYVIEMLHLPRARHACHRRLSARRAGSGRSRGDGSG